MRITNQMLARTAKESGIPLQQNSLLNIMSKKDSPVNLLSSLDSTGTNNSLLQNINSKSNKKLEAAAENLSSLATKLYGQGEDSLFAKAEETGDTSELVSYIEEMADAYNETLKHLEKSDSPLNDFYSEELKSYVAEQSGALQAIGITTKKDGGLSIQKDILENAGIDSLKAVFGSSAGFIEKVGYVSGRVAENAAAMDASLLNSYDATGAESMSSFLESMYDFWG